jgi:hypothetical protein
MQKLIWGIALFCAGVMLVVGQVNAGAKTKAPKAADNIATRSEKFLGCTEFQSSKSTGSEGDFLEYKCTSQIGPPMWMLIQEATRFSFGFGTKENTPQMAAGDGDGAIEWWGKIQKGKFVPSAVIKRFTFSDFGEPEKRTQQLVVFRLLRNGKSCVLAVVNSSATENAEARKIAFGKSKCLN